jgi:potassium-transporting ATPase KdpC subunit
MKRNFMISVWMTLLTTVLLGIVYPLIVTELAQWFFPRQANGEMIQSQGKFLGSSLIGQPFSSPGYFHSRPSAAGPAGYDPDAAVGGASNLGPTNHALIDRVNNDVQRLHAENPYAVIPVDLVTSSGSGLDPHITPASAEFHIPRVARERGMTEGGIRDLVVRHTEGRQWGFLGEPRVNVLELNLELDAVRPMRSH